jgi:hypothetical protein
LSANYLVFIVPPWKLPAGSMAGALSGASSFGHAFQWTEGAGAWMMVLNKSDLSVGLDTTFHNTRFCTVKTRLNNDDTAYGPRNESATRE